MWEHCWTFLKVLFSFAQPNFRQGGLFLQILDDEVFKNNLSLFRADFKPDCDVVVTMCAGNDGWQMEALVIAMRPEILI